MVGGKGRLFMHRCQTVLLSDGQAAVGEGGRGGAGRGGGGVGASPSPPSGMKRSTHL